MNLDSLHQGLQYSSFNSIYPTDPSMNQNNVPPQPVLIRERIIRGFQEYNYAPSQSKFQSAQQIIANEINSRCEYCGCFVNAGPEQRLQKKFKAENNCNDVTRKELYVPSYKVEPVFEPEESLKECTTNGLAMPKQTGEPVLESEDAVADFIANELAISKQTVMLVLQFKEILKKITISQLKEILKGFTTKELVIPKQTVEPVYDPGQNLRNFRIMKRPRNEYTVESHLKPVENLKDLTIKKRAIQNIVNYLEGSTTHIEGISLNHPSLDDLDDLMDIINNDLRGSSPYR